MVRSVVAKSRLVHLDIPPAPLASAEDVVSKVTSA